MKPKVSIIVPIYNSEKFLERCISSLINQTLKEIEIILVSDASPDNSKEIMERYAKEDKRIVTIYNEINGSPNPRNAGILVAKADYLGFVDADDWVELDMYERLYEKTEGGKTDVVISDLRKVSENGDLIKNEVLYDISLFKNEGNRQIILDNFAMQGGRLFTNIWKKSIIIENNLLFLEYNQYGDYIADLWYLVCDRFAKVDEVMYNYLQNTLSVTQKRNNMRVLNDRPFAAEDMINRSKSLGLYNMNKDVIDYRFYTLFLHNSFLIFSTRYTWPQYKAIRNLKKRFYSYLPNGIKANKYYNQDSNRTRKIQYSLVFMNTYVGATLLWMVSRIKNIVK